ncbi:class I SAM-dependent methyltransferase [Rhodoblastus acidophilus]|uniref:Class I SAM-dependent methyltransferase n=1 Tax=Candidatus Rhodoblastus alkanivorans TaxID=2954117 RepID=A0ABS9Z126_9HYPH|nr:methyltransferase domain-containing protein [Candidatus Rhodoblastus alkanivorans]MCI4678574.1 class I SAM-dependent methyltransferase [Candidatus Rhodoblastus alkanivorans]MCI4681338.1 class I SAM-dependent methyltransferase [Candidatus Rhodoblastus alkanivorans]MDI4642385.1 class I SAM-dependent methyltransferase [Rhodoblastus acidophilus]
MTGNQKKRVLNAGCGVLGHGRLPAVFAPAIWQEVRLDVDPATRPDIVGSLVDMRAVVADGSFDALYSSHAIEHLYAHEVIPAFREFRRILKPDGFALLTCPDLMAIARLIVEQGAEVVAYQSPAGPIRPIDMLFGHGRSIGEGRVAMAHRTGFTAPRLARVALESGFKEVRAAEGGYFDLWAILLGPQASDEAIAPIFAGSDLARLFGEGQAAPAAPAHPPGSARANA